ncbi:MAG: aspartate carbamoyltransferase catalytic subunit [Acidimicrobiia bacterium]
MKGFLTVSSLGRSGLESLVERAAALREAIRSGEPVPQALAGRCVANVFFEPSTRTRLSFDLAAARLGGYVITFDPETSSTSKGESLRDTVTTISAIGADILVVRHSRDGIPQAIAEWTGIPVVNAGDGTHEHPTQAVLDAVTIVRHFGRTDGLRMVVVGDIAHSRVAGSLMHAMPLLGMELTLAAPTSWLPPETTLPTTTELERALKEADIVYLLRVQEERGGSITADYIDDFQLDRGRLARLDERAVIMHAGPMNRGVEISEDVADSPRSLIVEQVRNAVPTRMAVLEAVARDIG